MDTQTQIDRLIELAIVQRSELKQLVSELPQLREYLGAEIERTFEESEPQIRTELEEFCRARATDEHAKTGAALAAKVEELSKQLEVTTAAKYSVLMAERAENANLLAKAEARIEDAASMLSHAVKEIVTDELSRFPRAGEIDQLRKEFAEPRGLNPRGRWMPDETYQRLDLVTINGDSFVSNIDGNRERPSRTAGDWTLSAARGNGGGGGGVTTMTDLVPVPTDGQLLIGNGSAFVNATLTAGTGISISNGPGSITINATDGNITLDDGTAAAPSLNFTSDTNTGLYRPAADTVGIVGGGHDIVRLTDVASATDYLEIKNAIGVATPLHVLASGPSTNIGMHLQPKGSGLLTISDGTDFNKGIRFRSSSSSASAITLLDAVSTAGRVITLPDATDTLVGKATTDTLTNKTLTSPTLTTPISATLTAPASTNLTLAGGSSGASLVLEQGANGSVTITPAGTGDINLTSAGSGSFVFVNGGNPILFINETDQSADARLWAMQSEGGLFKLRAFNDALSSVVDTFAATRTGNLLIGTTDSTGLTGAGGLKINSTTAGSSGAGALVVAGGISAGQSAQASYFGGAVTFGGNLIVAQDKFSNFDGSGAARMGMQAVSVAPYSVRMLGSADAVNTRDFSFGYYTGDNAANAWNQKASINSYTGAATFAGAVTAAVVTSTGAGYTNSGFQITNTSASRTTGLFLTNAGVTTIRDVTGAADLFTIAITGAATFAGTVIAPAATASLAPLRIPHGTAPTSPTNGDMWTTTAGLFIRINGATVGPLS